MLEIADLASACTLAHMSAQGTKLTDIQCSSLPDYFPYFTSTQLLLLLRGGPTSAFPSCFRNMVPKLQLASPQAYCPFTHADAQGWSNTKMFPASRLSVQPGAGGLPPSRKESQLPDTWTPHRGRRGDGRCRHRSWRGGTGAGASRKLS